MQNCNLSYMASYSFINRHRLTPIIVYSDLKLIVFALRDPHGATMPHYARPFAANTIDYLSN